MQRVRQVGLGLVSVLALVAWPSPLTDAEAGAPAIACAPNRPVILIFGTGSTGQYDPNDPVVGAFDPLHPTPAIVQAALNVDYSKFLFKDAAGCRTLTLSWDDYYYAASGPGTPGVNAWNRSTSAWNTTPDVVADHLQRLMDAYPDVTFDIAAYSAGGAVPTFWAARTATTDAQRARVHSIVVLDGIVSGVDLWIADTVCGLPHSIRDVPVASFGRFPCHFRKDSPYTWAVRASDFWTRVKLFTLRAEGDRIVWHEWAGLPPEVVLPTEQDPSIVAVGCASPLDWIFDAGGPVKGCAIKSHGSILLDQTARNSIERDLRP